MQTKGQLFPTCVSYAGYAHQREESPAIALPYCFSVFIFLTFPSDSRPGFQKQRDKKWNSLMFLLSPALLLTADMEDGRLEIRFIIS